MTTAHACAGVWGLRSSVLLSSRRVSVLRAAASEKCTDESARQRDQANRARHRCRGRLHVGTENITPTTNTVNGGVANTPSVLQQARAVYSDALHGSVRVESVAAPAVLASPDRAAYSSFESATR